MENYGRSSHGLELLLRGGNRPPVASRVRPDPQGTIAILRTFWDPTLPQAPHPSEDIVHPMLVEADHMAIDAPRTLETARMTHDRFPSMPR